MSFSVHLVSIEFIDFHSVLEFTLLISISCYKFHEHSEVVVEIEISVRYNYSDLPN